MELKKKVHEHFSRLINEKVRMLQQVLDDLKASASNETKSTAGDKHETALAMLQIEQENKRNQLRELLSLQSMLERIDPALIATQILNGSLVETNRGWLFLSVAAGRASVDDIMVTALSPQSPLGQRLMGLRVYDKATFNNTEYVIKSIR